MNDLEQNIELASRGLGLNEDESKEFKQCFVSALHMSYLHIADCRRLTSLGFPIMRLLEYVTGLSGRVLSVAIQQNDVKFYTLCDALRISVSKGGPFYKIA